MQAMAIDRRSLLIGTGAALVTAPACAGAPQPQRFAAAYAEDGDRYGVAVFDLDHGIRSRLPLPARGHDVTWRPGTREAVVFARRPGRFAIAFDLEGKRLPIQIDSDPGRHFFGHGVFASDGRLLLSTENDIAGSRGVLGVRDATDGYRPIGLLATGGIGPHDVVLLSDGRTLAVANGGIDTDPNGRDPLNLADMRASLGYVDISSGDLLETMELEPDLRLLSIRHLALGRGDTLVFASQWQGDATEHPPLVGLHRRGEAPRLIAAPDAVHRRLKGYIGSVAVDASGTIVAATSPKGGLAVYFELPSGRYLGTTELADVCGVSGLSEPGSLLLTSGEGMSLRDRPGFDPGPRPAPTASSVHWDNHVIALGRDAGAI